MIIPPFMALIPPVAALPATADFRETLIATVTVGLIAFAICGGLLAGFIRSLQMESDREDARFGRQSAWWLAALIASLIVFSFAFMWYALG